MLILSRRTRIRTARRFLSLLHSTAHDRFGWRTWVDMDNTNVCDLTNLLQMHAQALGNLAFVLLNAVRCVYMVWLIRAIMNTHWLFNMYFILYQSICRQYNHVRGYYIEKTVSSVLRCSWYSSLYIYLWVVPMCLAAVLFCKYIFPIYIYGGKFIGRQCLQFVLICMY